MQLINVHFKNNIFNLECRKHFLLVLKTYNTNVFV